MLQDVQFLDFEWDAGNWPKCAKHGLSRVDIESVFAATPVVIPTRAATAETRYAAIGRTVASRYAFIVFTLRITPAGTRIRPISARLMHAKEVQHYDNTKGT